MWSRINISFFRTFRDYIFWFCLRFWFYVKLWRYWMTGFIKIAISTWFVRFFCCSYLPSLTHVDIIPKICSASRKLNLKLSYLYLSKCFSPEDHFMFCCSSLRTHNFQSCDVMISISTQDRIQYLLNPLIILSWIFVK